MMSPPPRLASYAVVGLLLGCSGNTDGEVGVYDPALGADVSDEQPADPGPLGTGTGGSPSVSNPSDEFGWPEARSSDGECIPGEYTGLFNCEMNAGGLFPSGPIIGPVTFTLSESLNGEFLEISAGTLTGRALIFTFTSELSGKLDCSDDTFSAVSVNGVINELPLSTFSGTLEGRLDRATQTLTGDWSLSTPGAAPCVGRWSVVRTL